VAATSTPVSSASEQQQHDENNQDDFHGEPPFKVTRSDGAAQWRAVADLADGPWLFNARRAKSFRNRPKELAEGNRAHIPVGTRTCGKNSSPVPGVL
jgi:hypothetical protein